MITYHTITLVAEGPLEAVFSFYRSGSANTCCGLIWVM